MKGGRRRQKKKKKKKKKTEDRNGGRQKWRKKETYGAEKWKLLPRPFIECDLPTVQYIK